MATTRHILPEVDWPRAGQRYAPASLEDEGFIHCTNGMDRLLEVANLFYRTDLRPYLCIEIDLSAVDVPWRYDDPEEVFPHIYGPLDTSAVVAVGPMSRAADGTFLAGPD